MCKLSPRLETIVSFIEKDSAVADVGTDHGLLPVYLAQTNLARRIIATDISAGSLDSALRNAIKYGVEEKITFLVADGLSGVDESIVDTVVAAGIGGETIAEIIGKAVWTRNPGVNLILQPQTKTGELCRMLAESGYEISDAKLALDKGRYYIILKAAGVKPGMRRAPDSPAVPGGQGVPGRQGIPGGQGIPDLSRDHEVELLEMLKERSDPLFGAYLSEQIKRTHKAVAGTALSKTLKSERLRSKLLKLQELQQF